MFFTEAGVLHWLLSNIIALCNDPSEINMAVSHVS